MYVPFYGRNVLFLALGYLLLGSVLDSVVLVAAKYKVRVDCWQLPVRFPGWPDMEGVSLQEKQDEVNLKAERLAQELLFSSTYDRVVRKCCVLLSFEEEVDVLAMCAGCIE